MSRILVAEDSPTQAKHLQLLLEDQGLEVEVVENGVEALSALASNPADVVITDLNMPEMDGLQLVLAVREQYPTTPIILMTAEGGDDIAVKALQAGAASYVPKDCLHADIIPTLNGVLEISKAQQDLQRVMDCLVETQASFELTNDPSIVPPLVAHFEEQVRSRGICDDNALMRIGMALCEALDNAIFHGNLELDSSLREGDGSAYLNLAKERRDIPPYQGRRVFVNFHVSKEEASFSIRDEGPGFDPSTLPDPTDPTNLEKISGRGLMLIRNLMDEVKHNSTGNEITMIKRRDAS